jgi:2-keto-4-pentenoate hydratase/2-oxohepta-3-ene-1,7-dioic acid hydratase in catechol pathway
VRFASHRGVPVLIEGDTVIGLGDPDDHPAARFNNTIGQWGDGAVARGRPEPFDPTALGPPVPVPGKILGAPVNYISHKKEMKVEHTVSGLGFFLKSPSSITGMNGEVPIPFPLRRTDQEAELGVVIGKPAANVSLDDALDHVFGYTCLVDVTVRGNEERSTRKSFAGFTPIGPWITTADEISDPNDLRIRGWVNDELRQDASTSAMVYSVAQLIEFMSSVVTLEPGDIIATGTPAGVGPVEPGDVIRVEIERVGTLEVPVVAGTREPHPLWLTRESG